MNKLREEHDLVREALKQKNNRTAFREAAAKKKLDCTYSLSSSSEDIFNCEESSKAKKQIKTVRSQENRPAARTNNITQRKTSSQRDLKSSQLPTVNRPTSILNNGTKGIANKSAGANLMSARSRTSAGFKSASSVSSNTAGKVPIPFRSSQKMTTNRQSVGPASKLPVPDRITCKIPVFQRSKSCANLRRPAATSTPLKPSVGPLDFCISPIEYIRGKIPSTATQQLSAATLPVPTPKVSQIPRARSIPRHEAAKAVSNLPVKNNVAQKRRYPSLCPDESVVPAPRLIPKKQICAPTIKSSAGVVKARGETSKPRAVNNGTIEIDVDIPIPESSKPEEKLVKTVSAPASVNSRGEKADKTFTATESQKSKGEKLDKTVTVTKGQKSNGEKLDQTVTVSASQKSEEQKANTGVGRAATAPGSQKTNKQKLDKTVTVAVKKTEKSAPIEDTIEIKDTSDMGPRVNRSASVKSSNRTKNTSDVLIPEAEVSSSTRSKRKGVDLELDKTGKKNKSGREPQVDQVEESEKQVALQETKRGVSTSRKIVGKESEVPNVVDKPSTSRRGVIKTSKTAVPLLPLTDDEKVRKVISGTSMDTQEEEPESTAPVKRGRKKLADQASLAQSAKAQHEEVRNEPEEKAAEEEACVQENTTRMKRTKSTKPSARVRSQSETSRSVNKNVEVPESDCELPTKRSKRTASVVVQRAARSKHHEEPHDRANVDNVEVPESDYEVPEKHSTRKASNVQRTRTARTKHREESRDKAKVDNVEVPESDYEVPEKHSTRKASNVERTRTARTKHREESRDRADEHVGIPVSDHEAPEKRSKKKAANIVEQTRVARSKRLEEPHNGTDVNILCKYTEERNSEYEVHGKCSKRVATDALPQARVARSKYREESRDRDVNMYLEVPESEYEGRVKRSKSKAPVVQQVRAARSKLREESCDRADVNTHSEVPESEYEVPVKRSRSKAPPVRQERVARSKHREESHGTDETLKKSRASQITERLYTSTARTKESDVQVPLKSTHRDSPAVLDGVRSRKASETRHMPIVSHDNEHQSETSAKPSARSAKKQNEPVEPVEVSRKAPLKRKSTADSINGAVISNECGAKDGNEDINVSKPKRMRKDDVQNQRESSRILDVSKRRPTRTVRQRSALVANSNGKENNPKINPEIYLNGEKILASEACSSDGMQSQGFSQTEEDSDPERCCPPKEESFCFSNFHLQYSKKLSEVGHFWNEKPKLHRGGSKDPAKSYTALMLFAHEESGLQCGILELPPGIQKSKQVHSKNMLLTVLGGGGIVKVSTKRAVMNAGDLCVVPAGSEYAIKNSGEVPLRITILKLP